MTVAEPQHPDRHQLMTVIEVAAALRVSRATVYRLVQAGALPGIRVGKSVRISRRIVENFLRGPDARAWPP